MIPIMKNIPVILILLSVSFPQYFGGNISIIGQFPKDEFKEQGVPAGIGLDLSGMYYVNEYIAFGLNIGSTQYGNSERSIPLSYYTDLITITEQTSNNIGYGNILFRIIPFQGFIKPYFEGSFGIKNLYTQTKVFDEDCTDTTDDNQDDCAIANSKNLSDYALNYGPSIGLDIKLTSFHNEDTKKGGDLMFSFAFKYLIGSKADYLKKGDILYTDPEDGPVQTSFTPSTSKTNVVQFNIGLSVTIK